MLHIFYLWQRSQDSNGKGRPPSASSSCTPPHPHIHIHICVCTRSPRHEDTSTLSLWITGLGFREEKKEREGRIARQPARGCYGIFKSAAEPIRDNCGLEEAGAGCHVRSEEEEQQ